MTIQDWLGESNILGINIWEEKYRYNNETFDEFLDRISAGDEDLKSLIKDKKFLFGGRILANRGIKLKGKTYSNCYVIPPVEDNIESIYDTCAKLARTFSYGGGCGVDISKLRPKGATVNNAARTTTGAVSFMQTFSEVTETIGQHGRRGALMLSIDVNHPDVAEFIDIKTDLNKVTHANISVRVNDAFMHAVKKDEDYILRWPCDCDYNFDLKAGEYNALNYNEVDNFYYKRVRARDLFNKLVKNNWDYAEPGILYWDRIKEWNVLSEDEGFEYAGTNPCAEEPLPAGGSCLLGSLNLSEFVLPNKEFDFFEFRKAVRLAVRALNRVLVDGASLHPLQVQKDSVANWRQIGLGVMGIADMLIKMGIKYDSQKALTFCEIVAKAMASTALDESADMANSLEGAYPKFDANAVLNSPYVLYNATPETLEKIQKYGLYNSQILTIAPTGTLSTMLQISGGIEPIFAMSYERTTKSLHGHDEVYKVYTKIAQDWLEANPGQELPDYFVESATIDPKMRILMQSVWQNAIDASISSTVNLPEEATVDQVHDIYMNAWKYGLKGVTIFRAGCKRTAILNATPTKEEETKEPETVLPEGDCCPQLDSLSPITRDELGDVLIGNTYKNKTACGTLYTTVNKDEDGHIVEIFTNSGKNGTCKANLNGETRLASLCFRLGAKVDEVVDALGGIQCQSCAFARAKGHKIDGTSCPDIIAKCIQKSYTSKIEPIVVSEEIQVQKTVNNPCPHCGAEVSMTGGCLVCPECGYSKCE